MSGASSLRGPEGGSSPRTASPAAPSPMRSAKGYSGLVASVKAVLNREQDADYDQTSVAEIFAVALEETNICISQGFSIISTQIDEGNSTDILSHLQNNISILQLLSKYLKETVETVTMTCALFPNFPTISAQVILNVFGHCMDSEVFYGDFLSLVEKQLKELFRSCHELQLVYLMIMEKHFIFDLTEKQDLTVLCEALNTNIQIGETAIKLDIKTMAEQWKAFTALCEKYSTHLNDSSLAARCIDTVADVMLDNIKCNIVEKQEHKAVLRSLKVTSFLMKIVIKMCQLFKFYVTEDYTKIVLLLVTIKGYSESYLRTMNKPEQLIQQVKSHVTVSAEPLLNELLEEEAFAVTVMSYHVDSEDEALTLGYMLLLVSVMSAVVMKDDNASRQVWLGRYPQCSVVCCVLRLLSDNHMWLNYGLKFECWIKKSEPVQQYGLYEHLLTSSATLAVTADCGQYSVVEAEMFRSLLKDDCWTAMFASDLWVILARFGSTDLCIEHIITLIDTYKRLKATDGLQKSPQSIHLSKTITRLFNTLPNEDKLKILNEFSIKDQNNACVWAAVGVINLPEKQAKNASIACFEKLRADLMDFIMAKRCDIYTMIDDINLASTCYTAESVPAENIALAWLKFFINKDMSKFLTEEESTIHGRHFFTELIIAMTSLTVPLIKSALFDNKQLIQILDVLSSIIAKSSSALRISTIAVLTSLAYYRIPDDEYTGGLCSQIIKLFQKLLSDNDPIVKNKALATFRKFSLCTNKEVIIPSVVTDDLKDTVISFMKTGEFGNLEESWKDQLKNASQMQFQHKCIHLDNIASESNAGVINNSAKDIEMCDGKELNCNNFDMTSIDDLFENSDIEESQCKKVKLDAGEAEHLICSIENNVLLLKNIKENVTEEQKLRISTFCDVLKNIVT